LGWLWLKINPPLIFLGFIECLNEDLPLAKFKGELIASLSLINIRF
jgi:hypothetical protein